MLESSEYIFEFNGAVWQRTNYPADAPATLLADFCVILILSLMMIVSSVGLSGTLLILRLLLNIARIILCVYLLTFIILKSYEQNPSFRD